MGKAWYSGSSLREELHRRTQLRPEHPEHLSPGVIAPTAFDALLAGIAPAHPAELSDEGTPVRIEAFIDRLVEFGYHLEIRSGSPIRAGNFRQLWPPYVRMPTECWGRLERPILVGARLTIEELVKVSQVVTSLVLDQITDAEDQPMHPETHQRLEWYVVFGQLGLLYPRMSVQHAEPMFSRDHETGLTVREALHAVIQHPLPIRELAVSCSGSRCMTTKGEERIPVVCWDPGVGTYRLRADKLDASYPGTGVGSRSTRLVAVR